MLLRSQRHGVEENVGVRVLLSTSGDARVREAQLFVRGGRNRRRGRYRAFPVVWPWIVPDCESSGIDDDVAESYDEVA